MKLIYQNLIMGVFFYIFIILKVKIFV